MKTQISIISVLSMILFSASLSVADIIDCSSINSIPSQIEVISGDWRIKELLKPLPNLNRRVAVKSSKHVAFPGICTTDDGDISIVYREGLRHASGKPEDGRIMLVRSSDSGKTWSEPTLVYDDPEYDDRNAAISRMNDGTLCVIWDKYKNRKHHWAWLVTSHDDGETWSCARKITVLENVHTRSPGIDLGNGRWLFPWSDADHGERTATYFTLYDPKTRKIEEIRATEKGKRNWADEVCVTQTHSGKLVALIRSPGDPALWQIESNDCGRTWTVPHLTDIPSQFTPADILTLPNGWLVASFSFRERRNERLVVSRDEGKTWDVENSVDLFDASYGFSDRSYPATTMIDENTLGTTLYETREAPSGGTIYFVTTPVSIFQSPKIPVLYQGDLKAEPAVIRLPHSESFTSVEIDYRYTGLFGSPSNQVGIVMDYDDENNYTAFLYQMGAAPDRRAIPYNYVKRVKCTDGKEQILQESAVRSDYYDDGNIHTLSVRKDGEQWIFAIDGADQLSSPVKGFFPLGFITLRSAIAIYEMRID